MTAPLWIVDGSTVLLRAWFADAPGTTPDGRPNGALRAARSTLRRLIKTHEMTHCAVVFDQSLSTFRTRIDPRYKAHRPAPPPELAQQFRWLEHVAQALGCGVFGDPDHEADDYAASLAERAVEAGMPVRILADDKDLFQLVRDPHPDVCCISLRTGDWVRAAEVQAKLGVRPEQVVDYQCLVGDRSDGVEGVPGVGAKTAAGLLAEVDSLEALWAAPERAAEAEVRGARKLPEKLLAHRQIVALARRLVTLRRDLDLPDDALERCRLDGIQRDAPIWAEAGLRAPR